MVKVAGWSRIRHMLASLLMAAALSAGMIFGSVSPASAASVSCGWPRCTVYLNKSETNGYAYNGVIPQPNVGLLGTVWYIAAMAHRGFAIQYANRGMCVGFNLSAVPWESQGMFGYRC